MITIALPKERGGKGFITTVEVIYVRRCSSETNKLRHVHAIQYEKTAMWTKYMINFSPVVKKNWGCEG